MFWRVSFTPIRPEYRLILAQNPIGHLGKFTLSLHWMNLGNQPVEILVEDVYLLVVPSPQTSTNAEEDEARALAAKIERLENAELLHVRGEAETSTGMFVLLQGSPVC